MAVLAPPRPNKCGTKVNLAAVRNHELEQLLARIEQRDRIAFRQLYALTSKPLFNIVLSMVRQREIAEEVTQDTYVTIWNRAGHFDASRGRPFAWLATIARNRAIDRLRRDRSRQRDMVDVEDCGELEDQLAVAPSMSVDAVAVRCALNDLKPEYREAILLAYFRGCSHAEIAETMAVPLGTAKSWVRRGLSCLQQLL